MQCYFASGYRVYKGANKSVTAANILEHLPVKVGRFWKRDTVHAWSAISTENWERESGRRTWPEERPVTSQPVQ